MFRESGFEGAAPGSGRSSTPAAGCAMASKVGVVGNGLEGELVDRSGRREGAQSLG